MLVSLTSWRQLAPLLVLVLLLSASVSTTTFLLRGSSAAFVSSEGVGTNIVIISGGGRVPETGAVSLGQVHNATLLPGVLAVSPEVYAPVAALGKVVVARGVNASEFYALQPVSLSGTTGPLTGDNVYLGSRLAASLDLPTGSTMVLQGLLASSTKTALIAGIISAGQPFDDEIIVPLQTARELRGLSTDQVTFLRVKVDPAVLDTGQLLRTLRGEPGGASKSQPNVVLQQLQLAPTTSLISIVPAGATSSPTLATAFDRGLGLAQSVFESLAVVVLIASLLAVYFGAANWLAGVRSTAATLSSLGLGRRRLLIWLLVAAVPLSTLSGLAGYLVAYLAVSELANAGALSFFFQPLSISVDTVTVVLASAGPGLAVAASVLLTQGRSRVPVPGETP